MKIQKMIFALVLAVVLVACQTSQVRSVHGSDQSSGKPEENEDNPQIPLALRPEVTPQTPQPSVNHPHHGSLRMAVVLGPGGLRAYAHVGVLQELVKGKIPIAEISGLELGALVGGVFANKAQIYDVEWQMNKLREDDFFNKSFLSGSKPQEISALDGFLQTALGATRAEEAKVPFSCPAYNMAKHQIYVMSRGPFTSMLPYCLPYLPFFRPFEQNIAGVTSAALMAKYLRSKGINYIIYVDVLGDKSGPLFAEGDSYENMAWNVVAEALEPQLATFDKVISVPLGQFYLNDFSKRRDMIQKGQEAGRNAVKELQAELGL